MLNLIAFVKKNRKAHPQWTQGMLIVGKTIIANYNSLLDNMANYLVDKPYGYIEEAVKNDKNSIGYDSELKIKKKCLNDLLVLRKKISEYTSKKDDEIKSLTETYNNINYDTEEHILFVRIHEIESSINKMKETLDILNETITGKIGVEKIQEIFDSPQFSKIVLDKKKLDAFLSKKVDEFNSAIKQLNKVLIDSKSSYNEAIKLNKKKTDLSDQIEKINVEKVQYLKGVGSEIKNILIKAGYTNLKSYDFKQLARVENDIAILENKKKSLGNTKINEVLNNWEANRSKYKDAAKGFLINKIKKVMTASFEYLSDIDKEFFMNIVYDKLIAEDFEINLSNLEDTNTAFRNFLAFFEQRLLGTLNDAKTVFFAYKRNSVDVHNNNKDDDDAEINLENSPDKLQQQSRIYNYKLHDESLKDEWKDVQSYLKQNISKIATQMVYVFKNGGAPKSPLAGWVKKTDAGGGGYLNESITEQMWKPILSKIIDSIEISMIMGERGTDTLAKIILDASKLKKGQNFREVAIIKTVLVINVIKALKDNVENSIEKQIDDGIIDRQTGEDMIEERLLTLNKIEKENKQLLLKNSKSNDDVEEDEAYVASTYLSGLKIASSDYMPNDFVNPDEMVIDLNEKIRRAYLNCDEMEDRMNRLNDVNNQPDYIDHIIYITMPPYNTTTRNY